MSCKHDPIVIVEDNFQGYPAEIGEIVLKKCATAGCHNSQSSDAAAGLNLESWQNMMNGGRNNTIVVPYSPMKSTLFLFTNTYEEKGPIVTPTMPIGQTELSKQEVETIKNWIEIGAPNVNGKVLFENSQHLSKYYVLNSLCDEVTVFDAESDKIIRYVNAGVTGNEGFPEMIKVAPNGKRWYVLFASGELIAFDANTDQLIGHVLLGPGLWRSFDISPSSETAAITNWSGNSSLFGGTVAIVDLDQLTVSYRIEQQVDSIYFPHGIAFNEGGNVLLVGCYTGNFVYKINLKEKGGYEVYKVLIDTDSEIEFKSNLIRPVNIEFLPDQNQFAVLCERINEVRIVSLIENRIEREIRLGELPQEMIILKEQPYLLISCMEDQEFGLDRKGSVYLINYETLEIEEVFYTGYQPKGLSLNKKKNQVIVANRNADLVGADLPHHFTDCQGNNGYVTIIDLNTMNMKLRFKAEVSVNPYSIAFRNIY